MLARSATCPLKFRAERGGTAPNLKWAQCPQKDPLKRFSENRINSIRYSSGTVGAGLDSAGGGAESQESVAVSADGIAHAFQVRLEFSARLFRGSHHR